MAEKMDRRVRKTKAQLREGLARLMQQKSIKEISVKELVDEVDINRSTFYRYFSDKYTLRDEIVDDIVQDFAEHMEVDFLHMNIEDEVHTRSLHDGLIRLSTQKCRLEILWNQNLLGRNVFDEMMNAGARKVEAEILNHPTISAE